MESAGPRLALIAASFQLLTGKPLVPEGADIAQALWLSPAAIVAHGTQPDPVFFFGNRRALDLFEMTPEQFIALPSRLSAEAPLREERAAVMARVLRDGFIDDYSGIRVSARGRRFQIRNAVVWNLLDAAGSLHGQAALFADWAVLD
jgi:hypothetical protein